MRKDSPPPPYATMASVNLPLDYLEAGRQPSGNNRPPATADDKDNNNGAVVRSSKSHAFKWEGSGSCTLCMCTSREIISISIVVILAIVATVVVVALVVFKKV